MTINKLGKKFNKIGNDPIKGIRFIMGFDKDRFLRYTGIRAYAGVDQLGGNLGMQMTAEQFHYRFNRGKNIIFSILKKGENAENEKDAIAAIKNRINYYGYAYARQRANARVNPFLQAEKNAQKEDKIIQMNPALAA